MLLTRPSKNVYRQHRSKAAIPPTSEHVSFGRTSGRSEGRFPDDGRLEQLLQLQIKAVASPLFQQFARDHPACGDDVCPVSPVDEPGALYGLPGT